VPAKEPEMHLEAKQKQKRYLDSREALKRIKTLLLVFS